MSAAPMKKSALPSTLRPVGSVPSSRSRRAVSMSVRESTSKTGLVSGWSPALGSSPVRIRRFLMPSAAAPINSLCSAMRFLSRQVSCSTGSMPASRRSLAAASAAICARAPAPSVTLTASARPLRPCALRNSSAPSNDTGGVISAVMTKRRCGPSRGPPSRSRSWSVGGTERLMVWSFITCSVSRQPGFAAWLAAQASLAPGAPRQQHLYNLGLYINSAADSGFGLGFLDRWAGLWLERGHSASG